MNKINLYDIFVDRKPKAIGLVADRNQGKSNLIYSVINHIKENYPNTNVYQYGLRATLDGVVTIDSIEKLEILTNCIIFIDEFYSLFELDNRKKKELIEAAFRLIHHNNVILVLCGLPNNFNKFVSQNLDYVIFKQCSIGAFINGSDVKNIALAYRGVGKGSSMIAMDKGKALFYDVEAKMYYHTDVPYVEHHDTKQANRDIFGRDNDAVSSPSNKKKGGR